MQPGKGLYLGCQGCSYTLPVLPVPPQVSSPGPVYFLDPKITRFGRSCTPAYSMQGRGKARGECWLPCHSPAAMLHTHSALPSGVGSEVGPLRVSSPMGLCLGGAEPRLRPSKRGFQCCTNGGEGSELWDCGGSCMALRKVLACTCCMVGMEGRSPGLRDTVSNWKP